MLNHKIMTFMLFLLFQMSLSRSNNKPFQFRTSLHDSATITLLSTTTAPHSAAVRQLQSTDTTLHKLTFNFLHPHSNTMDNIPSTVLPPSPAAPALAMGGSIQSTETVPAYSNPRLKLERLPEEMLLQIFQAVHDAPIPQFRRILPGPWDKDLARYDQGTRGIQNVRLTCRDFNRISSELLIRFVGVSLNEASLARFQAIMEHPTIGKGVSMVRIRLPIYEECVYNSRGRFAMNVSRLFYWIAFSAPNMEPEVARLAGQYFTTMTNMLPPNGPLDGELLGAIDSGWREYRRRYRAERILRKEQFVEDIIEALLARNTERELRLEITDQNDFVRQHRRAMTSATADNFLDIVSKPQPSPWDRANTHSFTPHGLAWMLPLIVKAFVGDRVGDRIRIVDLHFDISSMNTSQPLVFAQVDKNSFRDVMRNLRSFTFIRHDGLFRDEPGGDLVSVFQDCLPSTSLRNLGLESVRLRPCQLPNLSRISLRFVHFDLKSLALLLQPLEPHKVAITLSDCKVVPGSQDPGDSWADVLDLLRSKQCCTRLFAPKGEEFDGPFVSNVLPWQEAHWLSRQRYLSHVRRAEEYIWGWHDINPFREHQE